MPPMELEDEACRECWAGGGGREGAELSVCVSGGSIVVIVDGVVLATGAGSVDAGLARSIWPGGAAFTSAFTTICG